jgi:hypothetical protein
MLPLFGWALYIELWWTNLVKSTPKRNKLCDTNTEQKVWTIETYINESVNFLKRCYERFGRPGHLPADDLLAKPRLCLTTEATAITVTVEQTTNTHDVVAIITVTDTSGSSGSGDSIHTQEYSSHLHLWKDYQLFGLMILRRTATDIRMCSTITLD